MIGENSGKFWASFSISFLSSCFAIGKFLKTGPIKLLGSDGPVNGFITYGFINIFINVGLTILLKGSILLMPMFIEFYKHGHLEVQTGETLKIIITWILINILPQFTFVSTKYSSISKKFNVFTFLTYSSTS